ncbi:histone-like nucleoid-structuring protein Lsr2 [Streptomyces sp. NPDC001876]|uniref:Lsr2 family DNA-binding protein n=1 Tax=Streptomyces sp. NPDC001876 TaxID=3154402 RepID=UPI00332D1B92
MQPSPVPGPRQPQQAPSAGLTVAPSGALLAWATTHPDKAIARLGEQARTAMAELRTRKAAEDELAQVDAEEQELRRRLQAVQARKAALRPRKKQPARDYDPAEVRDWARAYGQPVPDRGQVPKAVVDAWREAQAGGGR